MITCDFENRGNAGLCEYLTHCIERQIENGVLAPDEKLPSKRELALHLGVSVITVQNAYADLISRGYVYSLEKKGFFVTPLGFSSRIPEVSSHRAPEALEGSDALSSSDAGSRGTSISFSSAPSGHTSDPLIDLRTNTTSYEKFPFSVWSRVTRQILQEPHEDLLRRQPLEGTMALRTAIARYLQSFRNMQVSPEQIIIAAGSEVLYSFLVQLFPAGTVFGVENPGYANTRRVLQACGGTVVPLPLDNQGLVVDDLDSRFAETVAGAPQANAPIGSSGSEANATCTSTTGISSGARVVHVTPNHHFPTGVVMSVQRRLQLLQWATDGLYSTAPGFNESKPDQPGQRFIIEDDYDSEFRFRGKPLSPLYAMAAAYGGTSDGTGPQVIYVNTFSKTLAPGFRISYMVLPPALLQQFKKRLGFYSCTVSALEQHTLARFMDQGHYARHIMRMKNWYRSIRDQLITAIESSPLKERCTIQEEDAGLHFLLTVTSPGVATDVHPATVTSAGGVAATICTTGSSANVSCNTPVANASSAVTSADSSSPATTSSPAGNAATTSTTNSPVPDLQAKLKPVSPAALQQQLKEAGLSMALLDEYYALPNGDLHRGGANANFAALSEQLQQGQHLEAVASQFTNVAPDYAVCPPHPQNAVFIVNYSGLSPATIRRAVEILNQVL